MVVTTFVLDDFSSSSEAKLGTCWELLTDKSMGGSSTGSFSIQTEETPTYLELEGEVVSTEEVLYTPPFIEISLPLLYSRKLFDAQAYTGVRLHCACVQSSEVMAEQYAVHLHTRELSMPWQYYRHSFFAEGECSTFELPFKDFESVNTNHELNPAYLLSLSIVAASGSFEPHLKLYGVEFYAS